MVIMKIRQGLRMLAKDRHNAIIEILQSNGIIRISDIASRFDVSLETARRDLINLQDRGLVLRVNGGAVLNYEQKKSSLNRMYNSFAEKDAVAREAAKLVHDGETIFLDAGTTVQMMARNLKTHHYLTVITYSLLVLEELQNTDNEVIMLGGTLKKDEHLFYGNDTEKMLRGYFVNKAFISCMGVNFTDGITDLEDLVNRDVLKQHSNHLVLLADSSKWGARSKIYIGPVNMIDTFIVDSHLDIHMISELSSMDKEVLVAQVNESDTDEPHL